MGYISRMTAKNGFSEIEVKDGQNKMAGMEVKNKMCNKEMCGMKERNGQNKRKEGVGMEVKMCEMYGIEKYAEGKKGMGGIK